jgi:hypothetical protein
VHGTPACKVTNKPSGEVQNPHLIDCMHVTAVGRLKIRHGPARLLDMPKPSGTNGQSTYASKTQPRIRPSHGEQAAAHACRVAERPLSDSVPHLAQKDTWKLRCLTSLISNLLLTVATCAARAKTGRKERQDRVGLRYGARLVGKSYQALGVANIRHCSAVCGIPY